MASFSEALLRIGGRYIVNKSSDLEAVSTEALRKLGRNILNFSKLEAGFKLLLSVSRIEGTTTTIRDNIKAKQSQASPANTRRFGDRIQQKHTVAM